MIAPRDAQTVSRTAAVPAARAERDRLQAYVRGFVRDRDLVPPLTLAELDALAAIVLRETHGDVTHKEFVLILLNNAMWEHVFARIPYNRRTLILPPCLRDQERCPAHFDELGLLCEHCGACPISALQEEAERRGYAVLIAEGTSIVTSLVDRGLIDGVVGVSCMESLEAAFPHMIAHAVPGLAIPLLTNGCANTSVDVDWIQAALRLDVHDGWHTRLDIEALRADVHAWFAPERLRADLCIGETATEEIALAWLARSGKRWRPFLTACVYRALHLMASAMSTDLVRRAAIAVECFHKASLVHDDIEDNDDVRYHAPTLHREHGIPIALNIGDLLIGEGYRLLASADADVELRAAMLRIAAEGHRALCLGQGEELLWMRNPAPLAPARVLDIFRLKTAPAFEVALRIGAVCAGVDEELHAVLAGFSTALGVAYQIHDDLEDVFGVDTDDRLDATKPSLLCALAYEVGNDDIRALFTEAWRAGYATADAARQLRRFIRESDVGRQAREHLNAHRAAAIAALAPLRHAELKMLLHRVVTKILGVGAARNQP